MNAFIYDLEEFLNETRKLKEHCLSEEQCINCDFYGLCDELVATWRIKEDEVTPFVWKTYSYLFHLCKGFNHKCGKCPFGYLCKNHPFTWLDEETLVQYLMME